MLYSTQKQRSTQKEGAKCESPALFLQLVARLKQQAREIKSQQAEIASELAQVKGSTRAHRFKEIEEENRALHAEIKRLTNALKGQKALFEKERAGWKRKVEVLEKKLTERRPFRKEAGRVTSPLEMVYTGGGGTLGNRREVSPNKSRCEAVQSSNQYLLAEVVDDVKSPVGNGPSCTQLPRDSLQICSAQSVFVSNRRR
jgi:DNA repair exonuclease SbcCD ATPase subunit